MSDEEIVALVLGQENWHIAAAYIHTCQLSGDKNMRAMWHKFNSCVPWLRKHGRHFVGLPEDRVVKVLWNEIINRTQK